MTFLTIVLIIITSNWYIWVPIKQHQNTVEFEKESTNLIFKEDRLKQLEEDKRYLKEELDQFISRTTRQLQNQL